MHVRKPLFRLFRVAGSLSLGVLSTACKLYMPTLAPTPLVQRNQVEVAASVQVLGQGAASVAYSPAQHFFMTASVAHNASTSGDYNVSGTQGDIGAGLYHTFGADKQWYAGFIGTMGRARSSSSFNQTGNSPPRDYRAEYDRRSGQLYLAWQGQGTAFGVTGRLTSLQFRQLTLNQLPPPEPAADLYSDYSLFARMGPGAVQSLLQVGVSVPMNNTTGGDSDLASSATLIGAGIILMPHLLRKRP
jgi:hypothetical protein